MIPDPPQPNIIFILADDMGYGDLRANNLESKIPTPHLDRLAAGGMRFTDGHAPSSVCTPSRYAILTGRYCWRSPLKKGVVWPGDPPLIEPTRPTVASVLRAAGYETAAVGKWHLGLGWESRDGRPIHDGLVLGSYQPEARAEALDRIDFSQPFSGPLDVGFDSFFGYDAPNFPPYTWMENDRVAVLPTEFRPFDKANECGPGPMAPGWKIEEGLPGLTAKVEEFIARKRDRPFFLYFALPSPHTPIVPNAEFRGASGAGDYGDFVVETDATVGRVMEALKRAGADKNTLVIFSSDNGPEHYAYERLRHYEHASMGDWRGVKRDTWEGGHRVPLIARWPDATPTGSVCDQLVSLADVLATAADIAGVPVPAGASEDGVSILPLLQGKTEDPVRHHAIHHSMMGAFAIRSGDWVYVGPPGGEDSAREPEWFRERRGYHAVTPGEALYHLRTDPGQTTNVLAEHPEVAERLRALLDQIRGDDAPTDPPGAGETLTE